MADVLVEDGYLKAGYSYLNLDGVCRSAQHQMDSELLMTPSNLSLQSCGCWCSAITDPDARRCMG